MTGQVSLIDGLASIVGRRHAQPPKDPRRYSVDGLVPQAIVEPGTYEEVAEVVRYAHAEGLAVIPWGGGTHMHIGNLPRRYDIALSLARLNKVIEHEAADLTVTCQAGTTVAELNRRLGQSGQMVPFSFNPTEPTTVGGLLATNDSDLRFRHGTPRDFTIGLRVVTADGRVTKTGGRVVKNVAGYDLCKLYIGSLGTLGIIVEATFKVTPLPQTNERVELEFNSVKDACDFAAELRSRGLSVWSMDISRPMSAGENSFTPRGSHVLSIELAGSTAAVERSRRETSALAQQAGAMSLDRSRPSKSAYSVPNWASREEPLTCGASVLSTQVPALVDAFDREAPGAFISVMPTLGNVVSTWLGAMDQAALVERLRAATAALGGTLVVRGCSSDLKRALDVFGEPPPSFELMRRIKQQFDPKGILSPGRQVGRL
jgi:glycolate oxidase FAD binding subunit